MRDRDGLTPWTAVVVVLLLAEAEAGAAQLRYHFVPADAWGNAQLQPRDASGAAGEVVTWLGAVRQATNYQPRPTHRVTFRHPYTGQALTVPVQLPEGTPRLEYRRDRIIYNYGSNTIEAHFLPDGSVELLYSSGLLRAP